MAKAAFTEQLAKRLLEMFDSEDPRERDYLKMALHRLYGRFLHLRTYMRDQMGYALLEYVDSQRPVCGIPEMLEIVGSIVNGFAVPLKPANVAFLSQVLLPLVKMPLLATYHAQLLYCLLHYLVKEPALVVPIFRYLFRHWPVQVAKKQVLLLGCVHEMVATLDLASLSAGAPLLLVHLAKTLQSPHVHVADKSFALLESDRVLEYARRNAAEVAALVCPALRSVAAHHWNVQLQAAALKLHRRYASMAGGAADGAEEVPVAPRGAWAKLAVLEKRAAAPAPALLRKRSILDDSMSRLLSKHGIIKQTTDENVPNMNGM